MTSFSSSAAAIVVFQPVSAGAGLKPLVWRFFAARRSELPVGSSYDQLSADVRPALAERWHDDHPDP